MIFCTHPFHCRRTSAIDAERRLARFGAEAGAASPETQKPTTETGPAVPTDAAARAAEGMRVDATLRSGLPPDVAATASSYARADLAGRYPGAPEKAGDLPPEKAPAGSTRDREAAHPAEMEGIATDDAPAVGCKKSLDLLDTLTKEDREQ